MAKPKAAFGVILLGLALSGISACQNRTLVANDGAFAGGVVRLGDTEVAKVDGTPIYLSDVERAARAGGLIGPSEALQVGSPLFQTTVQDLIDQRLLALDALRRGVDQQDEAKRRLLAARERILSTMRVEGQLTEAVTEESVRALFDAQSRIAPTGEERRLRHIVTETKDEIDAILLRLDEEEDFEDIAREASIDVDTADLGGDLGWVGPDMLPGPIAQAAFAARVGARVGPVQSPAGYHIIEVIEARRPIPRSYEETRDEIENYLTLQTIEAMIGDLRGQAEITLFTGAAIAGAGSSGVTAPEAGSDGSSPDPDDTQPDNAPPGNSQEDGTESPE